MGKVRDYKQEYARRVASATNRGFSRSQARGHARAGEAPAKPRSIASDKKLEAALRELRKSGNRESAAKAARVAPERFRRFLAQNVEVIGRGRNLKITDNRPRDMLVLSNGEARELRLRDFEQSSLNGRHLAAVRNFITSNDRDLLAEFEGQSVIDAKGRAHLLETNPNTLHRIAAAGGEVFHEIYRLII